MDGSSNTPKFTVAVVPTLSYDYMTYATNFSSETVPTGTAYVNNELAQAIALIRSGVADGSIIYSRNLTGAADGGSDPAIYGVVQRRYRAV